MTDKKFLEVLTAHHGNVTKACEACNVSREWYYRRYKADDFKKRVSAIKESLIDETESMLRQNILKGKEASIFFFLKTQAKHRGYIERSEVVTETRDIDWV